VYDDHDELRSRLERVVDGLAEFVDEFSELCKLVSDVETTPEPSPPAHSRPQGPTAARSVRLAADGVTCAICDDYYCRHIKRFNNAQMALRRVPRRKLTLPRKWRTDAYED
jgi:hypothetical protein